MVKPMSQMKNDRPQDAATAPAREIPSAAAAATEAVQEGVEAAGTVAVDALRRWTDGLAGLPLSVLAGEDVAPYLSGRAWLDGTFETVAALLTVQRQSVDRLLRAQHRIAAQLVDSGWTLTTTLGGVGLRGRTSEDER